MPEITSGKFSPSEGRGNMSTPEKMLREAIDAAARGLFREAALTCVRVIKQNRRLPDNQRSFATWLAAVYAFKAEIVGGEARGINHAFDTMVQTYVQDLCFAGVEAEWVYGHAPWEIARGAVLAECWREPIFGQALGTMLRHEHELLSGSLSLTPKIQVLLAAALSSTGNADIARTWAEEAAASNLCPESTAIARLIIARTKKTDGEASEARESYWAILPKEGCHDIAAVARRELCALTEEIAAVLH